MKHIKIIHKTEYYYNQLVTFGPHRLMMRPREGHDVHIARARLDKKEIVALAESGALDELCGVVARIGPPSYVPRYMLDRGLAARGGQGADGGLTAGFDAAAGWKKAMKTYLHCTLP